VGVWFNEANPALARPEYVGLQIPTLDEVFARYGRRINYYIETKSPDSADRMEERLLALLDRHRLRKPAARRWGVLIQSFSAASLQKIHALDPSLPLIQLGLVFGTDVQLAQDLDTVASYAVGIGPAAVLMDPSVVTQAHARCLVVHPWTVDQPGDMAMLLDLGVDGMFTDVPDELDEVLGRRALRARKAGLRAAKRHAKCLRAAS
jgi:glycerophosphoryl diester phosphodiesterase